MESKTMTPVETQGQFAAPEGATPYSRDLKNVETHLLDTGHFALETHVEKIASRIESFFLKHKTEAA
jgi:hypothetical protein